MAFQANIPGAARHHLFSCQYGCGGKKAGVSAHNDVDFNSRQGPVIEVVAHNGAGDEFRRCSKAGTMVGN